jgi:hypothetical protein
VNPQSETAASVAASSVPMFPCAEEPAAGGLQAYCRSVATAARVAAAVAEASGETLDRFVARAFAGRVAADDTGSAIVQSDGLALAASRAWEPRTRAAASIHIALVAGFGTPAAAVDSLFVLKVAVPAAVPVDDTHAAVLIFVVVPIDSAAALRAGLTFAADGLVANGWVLDGGGAARFDCDDPERDTAQSPRPALR